MEVIDSVLFSQLILNFETRLERSSNSSNFSDFPSNVAIVVVSDFGNLEILLILL